MYWLCLTHLFTVINMHVFVFHASVTYLYEPTNAHLVTDTITVDTTNDLVVSTVTVSHKGVSNLKMCIYRYFRSHIIILQQHVSVTSVTIIKVSYYKNTIKPFNSRRSDFPLNFNKQPSTKGSVLYYAIHHNSVFKEAPKETQGTVFKTNE
jgi:hypothetical protein